MLQHEYSLYVNSNKTSIIGHDKINNILNEINLNKILNCGSYILNSMIFTDYILLKNAETVCMNGGGDCLASRQGRALLERIAEVYPNIKFDLHTNGLLCNEKLLKELNILDRLSVVEISLHRTTKNTYDKIVLGSDWEKLLKILNGLHILKNKASLMIYYYFLLLIM